MNDHELELIARLAEGDLTGADAEAARALVDSKPEAAAEYQSQVVALAAIRDAGPARMTDGERSRLRGHLNEQLGIVRPEPAPARPRRRFAWNGIAVAAAALVGVVLLGPVLGILSTGASDSDITTALRIQDEAATDVAEAPRATMADTAAAEGLDGFGGQEDAELSAGTTAPATTVPPPTAAPAAPSTTTAAPNPLASVVDLGKIDESVLSRLRDDALRLGDDPAALQDTLLGYAGARYASSGTIDRIRAVAGCAPVAPSGARGPIVAAEFSGSTIIVYAIESSDGVGANLLVLDLDSCLVVDGG